MLKKRTTVTRLLYNCLGRFDRYVLKDQFVTHPSEHKSVFDQNLKKA